MTYQDWAKALRAAWTLATVTGIKHRVTTVPPTGSWPWSRWRIEPTATPTVGQS